MFISTLGVLYLHTRANTGCIHTHIGLQKYAQVKARVAHCNHAYSDAENSGVIVQKLRGYQGPHRHFTLKVYLVGKEFHDRPSTTCCAFHN